MDWTLSYFRLGPRPFSPNGDGRRDAATARFELTRAADARVRVLRGTTRVRTLVSSALAAGTHSYPWNGRDGEGRRVRDGRYTVRIQVTTDLGTRALSRKVRVDTVAPVARIVSASAAGGRTRVVVEASERGRLVVRFGSDGTVTKHVSAGRSTVSWASVVRRVRAVAWDAAENRSVAVTKRVRR